MEVGIDQNSVSLTKSDSTGSRTDPSAELLKLRVD